MTSAVKTSLPQSMNVSTIRKLGNRQSWRGKVEVWDGTVTYSKMAHAVSLGDTVCHGGLSRAHPDVFFQFVISDTCVLKVSAITKAPLSQLADDSGHQYCEQRQERRAGPDLSTRGSTKLVSDATSFADTTALADDAIRVLLGATRMLTEVMRETEAVPDVPGLYAIFCSDRQALDLLGHALSARLEPGLLYVGDTGARVMGDGTFSSGTLRTRVLANHFGNGANAGGSTLRLTLGSLLIDDLGLVPCPRGSRTRFTDESEVRLTGWMRSFLLLSCWPAPSSPALTGLEKTVIARLHPPLDLDPAAASPFRNHIKELRKRTREMAKAKACG